METTHRTGSNLRRMLASGLSALAISISPANARELVTIRPATESDLPGGKLGVASPGPVIEVEGIARGKYGRIRSTQLVAWIVYFGARPDWARRFERTDVFVDNVKAQQLPGPDHPKGPYAQPNGYAYPINFGYRTPGISGDPQTLKSAQTRCNEAIANATGRTRAGYIRDGVILKIPAAYLIKVVVIWDSRGRFERASPTDTTWVGATIKCLPTGHFAATSKSTSTSSASQAEIARKLNKKKKGGNTDSAGGEYPSGGRTNPRL